MAQLDWNRRLGSNDRLPAEPVRGDAARPQQVYPKRGRDAAAIPQTFVENTVSAAIAHISDDQFEEQVLKSSEPVLVDFWAEWCGPCRAMEPAISALATDYVGKVSVGKLNVDDNPSITMRYMVRGIPTVMLFKGGQIVDQIVGLVDKTTLKQMLDRHL
jgi:thioredoxin 1